MQYNCNYCSGDFCSNHRLPENHSCPGLRNATSQGPDFRGLTGESGILGSIFGWGDEDDGDGIARETHPGMKTYDGDMDIDGRRGETAAPGSASYEPESSPDVAPNGSVARGGEESTKHNGGSTNTSSSSVLGTLLVSLVLILGAPFRFLTDLPNHLQRFNRWLAQLLGAFYAIAKTTAPIILLLVVGWVVLFGPGGVPFDLDIGDGESPAAGAATPTEDTDGISTSSVENKIAVKMNNRREEANVGTLRSSIAISEVAREHSTDMYVRGFYDHTNPDGEEPWDRASSASECSLSGAGISENIHRGETDERMSSVGSSNYYQTDDADGIASYVVDGWMHSDGHRENMLAERWSHTGVGVHIEDGEFYATAVYC